MLNNISQVKERIKNTEVLFFDLDGTLIDTEPLYFRFWKEACRFYGFTLSDEQALSLRSRDRGSALEFFKKISGGALDYVKARTKRTELMNEYFKEHPIQLKAGVIEFLSSLKQQNKRLFIVTANTVERCKEIIEPLNLAQYFNGIISAKDVKRGKPFPDVYLKACDHVHQLPSKVVVFEDSPNGLKSASEAGCFTVMVEDMTPYIEELNYIDGVISSFMDLL